MWGSKNGPEKAQKAYAPPESMKKMQVAVKAKEVGGVTIVESSTSTGISDCKQAPVPVAQPESSLSN